MVHPFRLPQAFDGLRLVQLSDLHKQVYPHGERKLLQAVQACQPDMIVITGDLVSRTVTDFSERQELLMHRNNKNSRSTAAAMKIKIPFMVIPFLSNCRTVAGGCLFDSMIEKAV